jgi:ADP-ribose pyrophosphatase YjhB (NUDIX family)
LARRRREPDGPQAWLDWVRRLQAIAQSGLTYDPHPFHRERYEQIRDIAAEMAAAGELEPEELLVAFTSEAGHATPKVDVRAAAFRDDRVLLVRGVDDRLWTLPGGWAEVGERPSEAAEKELREESGHRGRAVKLIGMYERDVRGRGRFPFYAYKVYFLCELEDAAAEPVQASEIIEADFFAEDALPELSPRTPPDHLARAFAHLRDPSLPADFD